MKPITILQASYHLFQHMQIFQISIIAPSKTVSSNPPFPLKFHTWEMASCKVESA